LKKTFALFALLAVFSYISAAGNMSLLGAKLFWSAVISYFGFLIFRSNKISPYRSVLFILIAILFFLEFKLFRFVKLSPVTASATPYCHIAQSTTLFSIIHQQYLAITSSNYKLWGALTIGVLWLLMIFTIGPGICSWVCFYGGIDEGFSKIRKKPFFRLNVSRKWRDFPLAFLIFLLIVSFLQGRPVFCNWFCPLKMTGSFWDHQQTIKIAQIFFFSLILVAFLVVLPILTKKRTFCSLICPFGALASIGGKLSPYRVTIDKLKCNQCQKCISACPIFAIDKQDLAKHKISSYCNYCGRCIDICPEKAIKITALNNDTRNLFIFLCLLIAGAVSGLFVPHLILRVLGL